MVALNKPFKQIKNESLKLGLLFNLIWGKMKRNNKVLVKVVKKKFQKTQVAKKIQYVFNTQTHLSKSLK